MLFYFQTLHTASPMMQQTFRALFTLNELRGTDSASRLHVPMFTVSQTTLSTTNAAL